MKKENIIEALVNVGYGNIEQAVREFAKELRAMFCPDCDYGGWDIKQTIDNLIKEWLGERK